MYAPSLTDKSPEHPLHHQEINFLAHSQSHLKTTGQEFRPFAWICAVSPKFILGRVDNRDMSLSELLSVNQQDNTLFLKN
jgi:hypothetical protein